MSSQTQIDQVQVSTDAAEDAITFKAEYDAEEVVDDKPRSLLLSIAKQVAFGSDLTRVTRLPFNFVCCHKHFATHLVPAFICESKSFLDSVANLFSYFDYLKAANACDDPVGRITHLARYFISGFHIRTRKVRKPFNPVLGEYFRCYWDMPDGTRTWLMAEQVSHHPPISAFYLENLDNGYTCTGHVQSKSNFTGNSSGAFMVGAIEFHLLKRDEVYTLQYPEFIAKGILFGTMRMETVGEARLECLQTGLEVILNFKEKPTFGGEPNQYDIIVRKIPGLENPAPHPRDFVAAHPEIQQVSVNASLFPPNPQQAVVPFDRASASQVMSASSAVSKPVDWSIWQTSTSISAAESSSSKSTGGWKKFHGFKDEIKRGALLAGGGDWTADSFIIDYQKPPRYVPPPEYEGLTPPKTGQTKTGSALPFFSVQRSPYTSKLTLAISHQNPAESRVIWQNVATLLRAGSFDEATKAKSVVEAVGRQATKDRVQTHKSGWRQRFFFFDPVTRTPEDARHQPCGRWRMMYQVTCYSSDAEKDPANRTISCYNMPDQNSLFARQPLISELSPEQQKRILKKDEDNMCSEYFCLADAATILANRLGTSSSAAAATAAPAATAAADATSAADAAPVPQEQVPLPATDPRSPSPASVLSVGQVSPPPSTPTPPINSLSASVTPPLASPATPALSSVSVFGPKWPMGAPPCEIERASH